MISMISKITATIIISLCYFQVAAQHNVAKYEVGAAISAFIYQGDLTTHRFGSVETTRFGINLSGSKIISASFMLRTNLAIGRLKGDDAKYNNPAFRKQRNFNFRTPVFEVAQLLVWNLSGKNYEDIGLSPYVFGGAGLSFLKIKRDWSNFNAAYFGDGAALPNLIAIDAQHSLPKIIPVIPLGVGVRYGLTQNITINAESSYRLTYTDYIDGFSEAANPNKNDHYLTTSIGAIYRVGKKNKLGCPVVKY